MTDDALQQSATRFLGTLTDLERKALAEFLNSPKETRAK